MGFGWKFSSQSLQIFYFCTLYCLLVGWKFIKLEFTTPWPLRSIWQGAAPPISDQTSAVLCVRLCPTVVLKLPDEQISMCCLEMVHFLTCYLWHLGYHSVPFWVHYFSCWMQMTCLDTFTMGLALPCSWTTASSLPYWLLTFCCLSAGRPGLVTLLEHWSWHKVQHRQNVKSYSWPGPQPTYQLSSHNFVPVSEVSDLVVVVTGQLSWATHIEELCIFILVLLSNSFRHCRGCNESTRAKIPNRLYRTRQHGWLTQEDHLTMNHGYSYHIKACWVTLSFLLTKSYNRERMSLTLEHNYWTWRNGHEPISSVIPFASNVTSAKRRYGPHLFTATGTLHLKHKKKSELSVTSCDQSEYLAGQ